MILVIGATGNIGKHVVAGLLEKGVSVRAFTRDAERASTVLPQGAQIIQGDLGNSAEISAALKDVEKVFLATNGSPQQMELENSFIDAAREAGVRHLVKVSVIGASPNHFVVYAQDHAAIEQHLAASGLAATILRPNWFAENFFGSAETIIGHGAIYGSAEEGQVAFVDSRDTAAVAVTVLTEEGHTGKDYQITGPEALTFAEAAGRLAKGIGRAVNYVNLSDAQFKEALVGAGLPAEIAQTILQINRNARENNLAQVSSTVQELTGKSARPLEDFARDYASRFSAASI